jgi:hypothetical protein
MTDNIFSEKPKLSKEQLDRYVKNPLDDQWLRDYFKIPEDKYYSVSIYPEPGFIKILKLSREEKNKKISKSEQK